MTKAIPAKGWSGVAISDGKLFIGSLDGKLVGMEEDTGNRLFNDLSLETGSSGGFLGCGAAPITVAIYGEPIVSDNHVFVAGYNGKVYSIDATKGIKGWSFQPERGLQPIIGGLAIGQNALFFGTAKGYVYSIDATTSSQNWEFKTGNKIWTTPLVDNGTLYIGSFDKKLYALNTADGKEKWQFKTDGAIVSTPVVENNTVYFGTLDRYFYAVDATNGSLKWKSSETAGKWYWANPILVNNVIYAPNMDGKVYLINVTDGKVISRVELKLETEKNNQPISSSPIVVGNKIILATQDGRVWAIDTGTNRLSQLVDKSLGKIYASLSADKNVVFIHTQGNMLYTINADTGVVLWNKSLASN
jgi:outer membrane protein assembly factor BamB